MAPRLHSVSACEPRFHQIQFLTQLFTCTPTAIFTPHDRANSMIDDDINADRHFSCVPVPLKQIQNHLVEFLDPA